MARMLAAAFSFAVGLFALLGGTVGAESGVAPREKAPATEAELTALIDAEIQKVWRQNDVTPAKPCTDEEFVRRVYLQAVGAPPTPTEADAFLADTSENKRDLLVDALVADKRFGAHLADLWAQILVGRGLRAGGGGNLFAIWLSERFNKGDAFGDIVYDMLTAKGKLSEKPSLALFIQQGGDFRATDFAGNISRSLTGVQIQCAQCHKHPYEKWTEADFAGMASFFAPVQVRINFQMLPPDPEISDQTVLPARLLEAIRNKDRLPAEARDRVEELIKFNSPKVLDGQPIKSEDRGLWRTMFARWVADKENTQAMRYLANRFWSFAFGRALHEPVDDFTSLTRPSHPELLEALARDFGNNGQDYKRLYRAMFKSRAWQLSSRRDDGERAEPWTFGQYPVRQLSPEQFFASLISIAGGDDAMKPFRQYLGDNFEAVRNQLKRMETAKKEGRQPNPNERPRIPDMGALDRFEAYSARMSDSWLARRRMASLYVGLSSDDEMAEADGFTLSIDQALAVMNGNVTNRLSGSGRGTVLGNLLEKHKEPAERVRAMYLLVLSREPSKDESKRLADYAAENRNSPRAWEDVFFSLLMSTEFATDH